MTEKDHRRLDKIQEYFVKPLTRAQAEDRVKKLKEKIAAERKEEEAKNMQKWWGSLPKTESKPLNNMRIEPSMISQQKEYGKNFKSQSSTMGKL